MLLLLVSIVFLAYLAPVYAVKLMWVEKNKSVYGLVYVQEHSTCNYHIEYLDSISQGSYVERDQEIGILTETCIYNDDSLVDEVIPKIESATIIAPFDGLVAFLEPLSIGRRALEIAILTKS